MYTEETRRNMYSLISSQLAHDGYTNAANCVSNATLTPKCHDDKYAGSLYNLVTESTYNPIGMSRRETSKNDQLIAENCIACTTPMISNKRLDFTETGAFPHKSIISTAAYSCDGELSASCTAAGEIYIHQNADYLRRFPSPKCSQIRPLRYYNDNLQSVQAIAFHPTNSLLFSGGEDCELKAYAYTEENTSNVFKSIKDISPVHSLAVHPGGSNVLYTTRNGNLRFYDIESNAIFNSKIMVSQAEKKSLDMISIHPFGRSYACSAGGMDLSVYDGSSTKEIHCVKNAHGDTMINSIQYSKTGNLLLTAGSDNTVCIWDLRKFCTALKSFSTGSLQTDVPMKARFLWKEDVIICNTSSSALRGFDISTEQVAFAIQHESAIGCFVTSPTNQTIITGCSDMQLRFWNSM